MSIINNYTNSQLRLKDKKTNQTTKREGVHVSDPTDGQGDEKGLLDSKYDLDNKVPFDNYRDHLPEGARNF